MLVFIVEKTGGMEPFASIMFELTDGGGPLEVLK
jgi:hypothetical protein